MLQLTVQLNKIAYLLTQFHCAVVTLPNLFNFRWDTLYIPSYRFPSSGEYLLCFLPLQLRTTLTGLPSFQFLDSAPFLSLTGTLQLRARALEGTTQVINGQN